MLLGASPPSESREHSTVSSEPGSPRGRGRGLSGKGRASRPLFRHRSSSFPLSFSQALCMRLSKVHPQEQHKRPHASEGPGVVAGEAGRERRISLKVLTNI